MNAAHVHLVLNHFPLVGLVFSFFLLALGSLRSNVSFLKAGLLVVLVSGALAVPTFLSGEPAEEVIEKQPGFSEQLVEPHEEAAELAIWFVGATTLAAAIALMLTIQKRATASLAIKAVIVLNLISLVLIGRASSMGGKISHPEIRDGAVQSMEAKGDDD